MCGYTQTIHKSFSPYDIMKPFILIPAITLPLNNIVVSLDPLTPGAEGGARLNLHLSAQC